MNPALLRRSSVRLTRRARRALTGQQGFTIVETLMAGVILLILATGIAGVLTSSIAANTVARERTVAEQCANDQVERIRRIPDYKNDVGTVGGNPPGIVPASAACGNGIAATATVGIAYVDDPTPTSYGGDNYKRVTVTVTRDRDGKQLARVVTIVAPDGRPSCPSCGATINVTVVDLGLQQPYEGATVALSNGPSSNRSDVTDSAGLVSFGALDPNPTTGPTAYYDLDVTAASGYQTLAADVPPGSAVGPATASHIQVAPGQTYPMTTIRIFKPATINLVLLDAGGNPYMGGAALRINSSFTGATTTDSVAAGSSAKTITSLGGDPVIPGATYTIEGRTTGGLCAFPAASPVPSSGYPGNTSQTFTLQFTPCPSGDIAVNVKQLGVNMPGASVVVSGGPNGMSLTGTTDAAGNVTFTVPEGTGYTVTATRAGQSVNATGVAVTVGATTSVPLVLPNPPTGTLVVNVTQFSLGVAGATVTLTDGPWAISVSGTTNGSGQVTFSGVPGGNGYTITATKGADTASTTSNVPAGSSTTVNLALPNPPAGSVQATVTWLSLAVSGATVTLSGGPSSVNVSGTSNASGVVTFTNVPAGSGYTVTATRNGQSANATGVSVSASLTTNVAIAMPTATLTVTATWAGQPAGGASVSVAGGPMAGTYPGTTNASTGVAAITVPTTSSNNYTVTVTKGAGSGSSTVTTVPGGGQSTSVALAPTKTLTLLIRAGGVNIPNQPVTVSLTDGPNGNANALPAYQYVGNTNGSSRVVLTVPSEATGTYTVKVYRTGCPGSTNRSRTQTVNAAAGTTSATINMTTATCPLTLP